jgi:ABC-2 type transport system permease protein
MKTLKWLVLREFWEHKGGFVWAPIAVATAIILLMVTGVASRTPSAVNVSVGTVQKPGEKSVQFDVTTRDGSQVGHTSAQNTQLRPNQAISMRSTDGRNFATPALTSIFILTSTSLLFAVWAVFAVFYCAGALYDERKDRSVLFWKSLPITDSLTVTSKAVMVLVAGLGITWLIATMVTPFLMGILWLSDQLDSPVTPQLAHWTVGMSVPLSLAALLPIYALWALPTVGWLLMVSAWARSKPLLWGLFVPLLAGGLLAWVNRAFSLGWGIDWFWQHIVLRIIGGLIPGAWFFRGERPLEELSQSMEKSVTSTGDVGAQLVNYSWSAAATPEMWIGVAAGVLMLTAAIYLRRWRDEG